MKRTTLLPKIGSERDWIEDFNHENGKYLSQCGTCAHHFYGHMSRFLCKLCWNNAQRPKNPITTPIRITLSRRKGWKMPDNTVIVARPSKYGNPHRIGFCPDCGISHTRAEALDLFESMMENPTLRALKGLAELRGKNLACWCKPGEACHADVLLRLANQTP